MYQNNNVSKQWKESKYLKNICFSKEYIAPAITLTDIKQTSQCEHQSAKMGWSDIWITSKAIEHALA